MENGGWKRKTGAGWEVSGLWCAVCGGVWWVVVCGNGSGSMDPVTPDVLGSTVADMRIYIYMFVYLSMYM